MVSILSAAVCDVNQQVNFHEQNSGLWHQPEYDICEFCNGAGFTGGYYTIDGETTDDITFCTACYGSGYGLDGQIIEGIIQAPPLHPWIPEYSESDRDGQEAGLASEERQAA